MQAGGIWLTVQVPDYPAWVVGALLQGIGRAMVYPTLAGINDVAHPEGGVPASVRPKFHGVRTVFS